MKKNDDGGSLTVWRLWPQAAAGLILSAVMLFVMAWLVSAGLLGESSLAMLAMLCCFAGALTGAFLAAKRMKSNTLLVGALCGMALFLAFFLLGLLFSFKVAPSESAPRILLSAMLGGCAGGFFGGMKPKRKRH